MSYATPRHLPSQQRQSPRPSILNRATIIPRYLTEPLGHPGLLSVRSAGSPRAKFAVHTKCSIAHVLRLEECQLRERKTLGKSCASESNASKLSYSRRLLPVIGGHSAV